MLGEIEDHGEFIYDTTQNLVIARTPKMQRVFEQLQTQLNRYTNMPMFDKPPQIVDGIIGANTIAAATAVGGHLARLGLPMMAAFTNEPQNALTVAIYAKMLRDTAEMSADAENLEYQVPFEQTVTPENPAPAPPRAPISDRVAQMPVEPPPAADDTWMFWVGGGLLALGTVVAGVLLYQSGGRPRRAVAGR